MRDESGFTLIETLAAVALIALLTTLSAYALRNFWFAEAVDRGTGEVTAMMKRTQQRVVAETHPLVYGLWFKPGSSNWGVVKFDPKSSTTTSDDVCTKEQDKLMSDGVEVNSVTGDTTSEAATKCMSLTPGSTFVFFYARGTATEAQLVLGKDDTAGTRMIRVYPLTGRVERT